MFATIRQWESLYQCSSLENPAVCSTQTSDMKRPPLVKHFLLCISMQIYVSSLPLQNAGPYTPTKDTYYEKEALPKGPLTNVTVF
jgi:hypothetical protein